MPKDTKSLDHRLRQLEAREEIWQLLMDYRRHLDQRDFEAYSGLFAEDGEWIGMLGRAKGPAAILELMREKLEVYPDDATRTHHLVANPTIAIDGDRANAETTWCFITRDDADRPVVNLLGHYRDQLVRENGAWKFARRQAFTDMPYLTPDPSFKPGRE